MCIFVHRPIIWGYKLKMDDRRGCMSDFFICKSYRGGIKMKNVYFCMLTKNMGSKKNGDRRDCVSDFVIHRLDKDEKCVFL